MQTKQRKNRLIVSLILVLSQASAAEAKAIHQTCDGEQKTCCSQEGFTSAPPMWVNQPTCPKGMVDDASCAIQYGCKQNEQPKLN